MLCEQAGQVVVASDSTKLAPRAFARICPTGQVDTLVTDSASSDGTAAAFEESGVTVIRA
ncbi:hypothetical protein [Streptomyces sp. SCSIO 30461]|uniref:hypothetical protein n=1 Tax=Streptomyces sp. SCSIO 30461 TaxID=3118085 RepID=UPI00387E258F